MYTRKESVFIITVRCQDYVMYLSKLLQLQIESDGDTEGKNNRVIHQSDTDTRKQQTHRRNGLPPLPLSTTYEALPNSPDFHYYSFS